MYSRFLRFRRFLYFIPFFAVLLNVAQCSAIELTSDVSVVYSNYQTYLDGVYSGCTREYSGHSIHNNNADTICNITSLSMSVADTTYNVGDYIVIPLYLINLDNNNSLDAFLRVNGYSLASSGSTVRGDLVDTKVHQLSSGSALIEFYFRIWQAGNIYSVSVNFTGASTVRLFPREGLEGGIVTVWHERKDVDYSTSLGNISSFLSDIRTYTLGASVNTLNTVNTLGYIQTDLGVVRGDVTAIRQLINSQSSTLTDIEANTQNVSDWADEQRQAYENMQDTDGLINIGDQQQALGLVGSFNSFFGQISSESVGNCIFDMDFGNLDLGEQNFCNAPQEIRATIGTIATIVFAVFDIFIAISTFKYIIALIDWARRN